VICDLYYPDEVACGEDNVVKFQSEGLTLALMSKETSSNGYILRKWTKFSFKYIEIIARNEYSESLVIWFKLCMYNCN